MKRPVLAAALACLILNADTVQSQPVPIRPPLGKPGFLFGPFPTAIGPAVRGVPLARRPTLVIPLGFPIAPFASLGWVGVWGTPNPAPTIVVLPPIVVNVAPMTAPSVNVPPSIEDEFPPGAKIGEHLVIRPKKALPILPPPEPPAPKAAPPAPRPRPPLDVDPFVVRKTIEVDKPDPDPVKELARLIKLGKEAFSSGEFGAAREQFDRAIAAAPKSALPVFLKAQAAFASGRYDDAVKAIRLGLELDRAWPSSPFDPKELYGANPAQFNEHLAALRAVAAANPGDPTLEFLLGYELWFIGEKAEAKKWFDLVERRLGAPGPIAHFK